MNDKILQISDLAAGYEGRTVIEHVNLEVRSQDFIGIVGPNGGGKTTLLKVVLGLLLPMSGDIRFFRDGQICDNLRIGYMPQQSQTDKRFPITVHEVVLSGMDAERRLFKRLTKEQRQRARDVEESLGLSEIAHCPLGQLSGGQRQRTLLGRALVSHPELLVLDEPDAYIDKNFADRLYSVLNEINSSCAVIIVSHDIGSVTQNVKDVMYVDHGLTTYSPDISRL